MPQQPTKPCGTRAAYQRHLRRLDLPCQKCLDAVAAEMRAKRAAKRKAREVA